MDKTMNRLYMRVTLNGKAPVYELMHNQMKLSDTIFADAADLAVSLIDLLTEKREEYEITVSGRKLHLSWSELHQAAEHIIGALRFERLALPNG
jgi:hypothetical protein